MPLHPKTDPPAVVRPAALPGPAARKKGWVRRLLPFLRMNPGSLLLAFVATTLAGGATAVLLVVQRDVLDLALGGRLNAMALPLALLVLLGIAGYTFQRMAAYRELKAANKAQFQLYDAVHERLQETGVGDGALSPGQLAARLNADIGALARAVAAMPKLAGIVVSTLFTFVLMFWLSPLLGGITLFFVPVLVLLLRRSRTLVRPATWTAQQREADVADLVNGAVTGVRVVKAFGQEQRETDRMAGAAALLYHARTRLARLQAVFQPLMESLSGLVQVVVVIVGGTLVLHHHLTLGTFLAFSAYAGNLIGTITWLADTAIELQEAGVCAERVLDLL